MPVAILAGQLRGQAWAARSLGELWLRVPEHPLMPAAVRDVVARALGESSLRIARRDAESASYVDVDGEPLIVPRSDGERAVTQVMRGGWPIAALIHEPWLETDSDMVEGLAEASLMLLEKWRLLAELRASRSPLMGGPSFATTP